MPQSLCKVWIHSIFSTKNRRPFLRDPVIRAQVHGYLAETARELGSEEVFVGGVEDHAHVLGLLPKTQSTSSFIGELKKSSSKAIKSMAPNLSRFYWQTGFAAFSVGGSQVVAVKRYIERQESHHRSMTFQEELRRFFDKHGVTYDERYVWG